LILKKLRFLLFFGCRNGAALLTLVAIAPFDSFGILGLLIAFNCGAFNFAFSICTDFYYIQLGNIVVSMMCGSSRNGR
jgi:hypothetical protein